MKKSLIAAGATVAMVIGATVAGATVAMVIGATVAVTSAVNASTSSANSTGNSQRARPVRIEVFAPERGANAGASGFAGSSTWKSTSWA